MITKHGEKTLMNFRTDQPQPLQLYPKHWSGKWKRKTEEGVAILSAIRLGRHGFISWSPTLKHIRCMRVEVGVLSNISVACFIPKNPSSRSGDVYAGVFTKIHVSSLPRFTSDAAGLVLISLICGVLLPTCNGVNHKQSKDIQGVFTSKTRKAHPTMTNDSVRNPWNLLDCLQMDDSLCSKHTPSAAGKVRMLQVSGCVMVAVQGALRTQGSPSIWKCCPVRWGCK